ncbi:MAG: phenylalanine--tRNA ligase subunit alpha [Candidatus Eisenbacteria bacterium]|uniref:Phenylalanine--tRNA ligase alpha subunit n=1 Tax=Eiseniibacteriota bacterium TaxID=2212470 RepID=A0A933W930_UNCEI|nr:phenylalanine--tRNA ligase subunit alpha [Candidatus Eisenbacteria bacterium]
MSDTLLAALDSNWSAADPAALTPDHAARLAELEQLDPALVALYRRGSEVLAGAADANTLRDRHTALLGRERGVITLGLAEMPRLSVDERKVRGKALNLVKRWLTEVHDARREAIALEREAADALDVTLPGRRGFTGRPHVLSQVRDDLLDLFHGLGFSIYTSPEVELDEYNFEKLNFGPDHPARDAHDTYFAGPDVVLRTHTSPGWVRAMEERKPPLRLVFPGRVYRAEAVDASHMDQFHQIDGLFVDRNVSMADLKATLNTFARAIYRADLPTRIIPIYFPFVEPGVQMDVQCVTCSGTGHIATAEGGKRCPVCKGTKWVEVLGAGMVHPNVFRAVGIDPEIYTGFAFGMGLERIAMGRYGIPEIRLFLENDLRFLEQF